MRLPFLRQTAEPSHTPPTACGAKLQGTANGLRLFHVHRPSGPPRCAQDRAGEGSLRRGVHGEVHGVRSAAVGSLPGGCGGNGCVCAADCPPLRLPAAGEQSPAAFDHPAGAPTISRRFCTQAGRRSSVRLPMRRRTRGAAKVVRRLRRQRDDTFRQASQHQAATIGSPSVKL